MTAAVVEAGPVTIRGPGSAPAQSVSVALACIDDPLALLDGRAVHVDDLWRDVLRAAAGDVEDAVVIVVPTWWPAGRIEVVTAAAEAVFAEVVVARRSILALGVDATVVELSAEWAVVTPASSESLVCSRDAPEVEAHLTVSSSVVFDTPSGVQPLSADVAVRLRRLGIPLIHSTPHRMRAAAATMLPEHSRSLRARPGRRTVAVLAGIAVAAGAAGGSWAAQAFTAKPNADNATRLLTEGRVTVRVPAAWTAQRVTTGAGSERVRVAPAGDMPALHITQSVGAAEVSLKSVAETLSAAMASEPEEVFVDFRPAGDLGGRPAVTYVERRGDTETRWVVLVDGTTRIAIGCQHPSGQAAQIEDVCTEAVLSARASK